MNELTIGPGDEASLSMGDMEGGGYLPGTLRETCRNFWRQASLASGVRWVTWGFVDSLFLEGSRLGASRSVGALLRELLPGDLDVGGGLVGRTSPHGCPLDGN